MDWLANRVRRRENKTKGVRVINHKTEGMLAEERGAEIAVPFLASSLPFSSFVFPYSAFGLSSS